MSPSAPLAPNALPATLEFLTRHAPFDRMAREDLAYLVERLNLGYYGKGEVVLSPEQGVAQRFYIIKQGAVQGEQDIARGEQDSAYWELTEGECFPLGALLAKRSVSSIYRAKEDTFCFELPADAFDALLQRSAPFQDFCTRRIASLLEQSKHIIQAHYSQSSTEQQSMNSPLSAILRREPVSCSPATPIKTVLETMKRQRIGSMVIVDEGRKPVGIFTLHDILDRVSLNGTDLTAPIEHVMSRDPTTLPPHALAFEAALVMARQGFRHVLVTEGDRLVGLVSEKDLFSLQRVGLRQVGTAIRNANDQESLKQSAQDIRQLGHNMLAQGVAAEQLTQILSTLNDLLTTRIIELELAVLPPAQRQAIDGKFCWLALGSEGRFEQTLNTDQDNGIVFEVAEGEDPETLRQHLLPLAQRINQALDACGFPLCRGEVMASNPKWCLALGEWEDTFSDWIFRGDRPVLLHATIFFDFRPLYGRADLAHDLRAWLQAKIKESRPFLKLMAENALGNRPPLGMVRDFAVGEDHTLDLKLNGITPFVDAARIFGLYAGIGEASTIRRLRAAGELWRLSPVEVGGWVEAFLFIQLLRLRLQHEQAQAGRTLSNKVDPDTLNDLDRRILKEAFRQGRKVQALLEKYFQF